MAMKPFVRIIKRGQKAADAETTAATPRQPAPDSSARAIKTTVSNWVREFQQRGQSDAKRAFNNLFKEPLPSPSET
ncbi:MAG TPA: hypothetical protein VGC89_05645 [Pyrinomonadaceae bacterium]|jgi:hypothetical protein